MKGDQCVYSDGSEGERSFTLSTILPIPHPALCVGLTLDGKCASNQPVKTGWIDCVAKTRAPRKTLLFCSWWADDIYHQGSACWCPLRQQRILPVETVILVWFCIIADVKWHFINYLARGLRLLDWKGTREHLIDMKWCLVNALCQGFYTVTCCCRDMQLTAWISIPHVKWVILLINNCKLTFEAWAADKPQ